MTEKIVDIDVDSNGCATVRLNRPDRHNAFDDAVIGELRNGFEQLATSNDVRVVVLASAGKSFSAGADLNWMKRMASYDRDANLADARELAAMLQALDNLPQPTIARVQGAAFGGAVGLVSCCDMAIAAASASFCLSEVKIGLIPATISPYVIRAIGERASRRYFMSAERFSADEALRLGLVSQLSADEQLDEAVATLVQQLLQNGPQAVRSAKQLVNDIAGKAVTEQLVEDTCKRIADIRISDEGQEGLGAFLEKRKPNWLET